MKLSQFLPTCGSKASTSVYPNPACEFCWQCWATARQVAADASVAFMPGSARSYQPALKWHFCGLEGTKMDQHVWCSFLLGPHDSKSLTYCAHFWGTALQQQPTRSLEGVSLLGNRLFVGSSLALLGRSGGLPQISAGPRGQSQSPQMRFTGWRCAAGDGPLPNPHLDASERPKVSQPVLSGPWIRCLSLHASSALLVGGLPTYLGSRTS